jgi:hypothetical protein
VIKQKYLHVLACTVTANLVRLKITIYEEPSKVTDKVVSVLAHHSRKVFGARVLHFSHFTIVIARYLLNRRLGAFQSLYGQSSKYGNLCLPPGISLS